MDHAAARRHMVETHIRPRGVRCSAVLNAVSSVPRHLFIPEFNRDLAYRDGPVNIGEGQTISQPYLVAMMTEHLGIEPGMRVLEIGTGSGYQTAILAWLNARITTVEIRAGLASTAARTLESVGATAIDLRVANGFIPLDDPPFDRIIVTAAPERVPDSLTDQLAAHGRMVIPAGPRTQQTLWQVDRQPSGLVTAAIAPVRFVPMTDDR